jgi:hypothetical protein
MTLGIVFIFNYDTKIYNIIKISKLFDKKKGLSKTFKTAPKHGRKNAIRPPLAFRQECNIHAAISVAYLTACNFIHALPILPNFYPYRDILRQIEMHP